MQRPVRVLIIGWLVTVCLQATRADDSDPKSYLLFPVTTPLQQELVMSSRAAAFAQVDVGSYFHDGEFDLIRLEASGFFDDLHSLRKSLSQDAPVLMLQLRYANVSVQDDDRKTLDKEMADLCRETGFAKVQTSAHFTGTPWSEVLANFADFPDDPQATEAAVENETARVYPVRTKLSRLLLNDPTSDCRIDLRQPIDGRFKGLSPASLSQIDELVAQLKLPQKRKVLFAIQATRKGRDLAERYFTKFADKPSPIDPVIAALGFQTTTFSMSTSWSNPEDLLGKPAPDFTLDSLSGEAIQLRKATKGRVAVIAFWGVACGPCRVEAPHLEGLRERFEGQGLSVVAVNGYNEPRPVVEEYIRSHGFQYAVALQGKTVATEQYQVASYPTTFIVDAQGTVVDYRLGFESGDEELLAATVEELLAERNRAK